MSDSEVMKSIVHYQECLEKYARREDEAKMLYCITKLWKLPVTIDHLTETGVGRTVNSLRKVGGDVGERAKSLVGKWKEMVAKEEEEEEAEQVKEQSNGANKTDDNENDDDEEDEDDEVKNAYSTDNSKTQSTSNTQLNHHSTERNPKKSSQIKDDELKQSKKHKDTHRQKDHSTHKGKDHDTHKDKNRDNNKNKDRDTTKNESKKDTDLANKHKHKSSKRRHDSDSDKHKSSKKTYKEETDSDDSKSKAIKRKHEDDKHKESKRKRSDSENNHSSRNSTHKKHHKSHKKKYDSDVDDEESEDDDDSHDASSDDSKIKSKKHSSKSDQRNNSKHKDRKDHDHESKSSSTSKDKDKTKVSSKDKTKDSSKSQNKDIPKKHSSQSSKNKVSSIIADGIGSGSGTSFAEALGMLAPASTNKTNKKKVAVTPSVVENDSSRSNSPEHFVSERNLLTSSKLEPLNINISSLLPEITPNYKPIGFPVLDNGSSRNKINTEDETLSAIMYNKISRTKVYSGNKVAWGKVPSLFDLCTRVLQDNIDALEFTGGVPYSILKPVLERANYNQLFMLEQYNPYLMEDTDELWKLHCQRDFRNKGREEMETWRDMYQRCLDERESRLRALTANIKNSQDKSTPVRQTKLAYVDSVVKPPRNIARKQAKHGTGGDPTTPTKKPAITPSARLATLASAGAAGEIAVPNPGPRAAGSNSGSNIVIKPKKAPLMQKTLALMKNRFRR